MKYIIHAEDGSVKWKKEFNNIDEAKDYLKKVEECKNRWYIEELNDDKENISTDKSQRGFSSFMWIRTDEWDRIIWGMVLWCLLFMMWAVILWIWHDNWYCSAKWLDVYSHFWTRHWCVNQEKLDDLIDNEITKINYGKDSGWEY